MLEFLEVLERKERRIVNSLVAIRFNNRKVNQNIVEEIKKVSMFMSDSRVEILQIKYWKIRFNAEIKLTRGHKKAIGLFSRNLLGMQ